MTKKTLIALAAVFCFGSAFTSAAFAGDFTADYHLAHGQKCETCHKTAPVPGTKVKKDVCKSCHSYEKLAQATAKIEPNPHYSHLGDVNCTECHKGHKKSELMCDSCHQFKLKVPHS